MMIVGIQFFTRKPKKTGRQHFLTLPLVSPRITSGKRAQKFHTDHVSLLRCGWCFWLAEASYSRGTTNQGHYLGLGSENVISISALVPQKCFRGEISGTGVAKCRLSLTLFRCLDKLAPVVQTLDSAIQRTNHHPADK